MAKRIISITDAMLAEGSSKTSKATITLTLDSKATKDITLNYKTVDGTAKLKDKDYVKASGTITFKAGQLKKTITLKINGDLKTESDEYFSVQFTNKSKSVADLNNSIANVTIINDDVVYEPYKPVETTKPITTPVEIKPTISRGLNLTDYEKSHAIVINGHAPTDYKTSGYRGVYEYGYFDGEREVFLFKNIHQVASDVPIVFAVKGLNGFQPELNLYKYNSDSSYVSFYRADGYNNMNSLGLFNRTDWIATDAEFDDTESWYKADLGIPSSEPFDVYAVVQNYWSTSDSVHGGFIVGVF